MMMNNYYSKTSPYHYKYKKYLGHISELKEKHIKYDYEKHQEELNSIFEKEKKLKRVDQKLKGLHWFDSQVFKIYYLEEHSLRSMSRATKISKTTLGLSIQKVKKFLNDQKN